MEKKTADPKKELFWFFVIMVGLGFIWLSSGGPEKESSKDPLVKPPAPLDTGETYGKSAEGKESGRLDRNTETFQQIDAVPRAIELKPTEIQEELQKKEEGGKFSSLRGKIFIETIRTGDYSRNDDAGENEYIKLRTSSENKEKIKLSGLKLKSAVTGRSAVIGEGVNVPYPGVVNVKDPIFLSPGDRVYVVTGRSPNGISFRLNKCTGYFEQFQNFVPSLPVECPRLAAEPLPQAPNALPDQCLYYIDYYLYSCQTATELPLNLSPECQKFIVERTNYNWCVSNYRSDKDFFKAEWRVYLGYGTGLWKREREIVQLLDEQERVIDETTY